MNARGYIRQLLGEQEQVLFVTRQHWLVLTAEIASETVLAIALLVLVTLIWQLWVPDARIALGYLLLLLPLASLSRDVLTWSNRQYIVTNRRVIQVAGVLQKDVTDSSLEKVNDVKMSQTALGRMLDYGDVEILTASELGVNAFKQIGQPIRFKTAMLNAKAALERNGDSRPRPAAGSPSIPEILGQLGELRQLGVLTEAEFQQKKAELMKKL